VSDLIAAGKLPADSTFRKLYGTGGMINDSFRTALANPPVACWALRPPTAC
jgi:hypothetical protein